MVYVGRRQFLCLLRVRFIYHALDSALVPVRACRLLGTIRHSRGQRAQLPFAGTSSYFFHRFDDDDNKSKLEASDLPAKNVSPLVR